MNGIINKIGADLCAIACLISAIRTENVEWVIAAAIFKVAVNVLEE